MKTLKESLKEHLKNPEFKKEWDALEPEFSRIRRELDAKADYSFSDGRIRESRQENTRADFVY